MSPATVTLYLLPFLSYHVCNVFSVCLQTLPPQANTTFSVVYLGRREGPVSAHLYIHTSLGVHKYPVSIVLFVSSTLVDDTNKKKALAFNSPLLDVGLSLVKTYTFLCKFWVGASLVSGIP